VNDVASPGRSQRTDNNDGIIAAARRSPACFVRVRRPLPQQRQLSPLFHAILFGHLETCRLLIESKTDVNAKDNTYANRFCVCASAAAC
jgi:hypothetical protein